MGASKTDIADSATAALDPPVTICVLLYGNYLHLAQRCVVSILENVPDELYELRVGLNAVSRYTQRWVDRELAPRANVRIYASEENIYKYPMMRRMFYEDGLTRPWVVWFDDDSQITSSDWLENLATFVSETNYDYIGQPFVWTLRPGQEAWIQEAAWYAGKSIRLHEGRVPTVEFVAGAYWAIKTDLLRTLDWPDPRLSHNGGDVMLGEAIHQQGRRAGSYWNGVSINRPPRRGASQPHPTL